MITGYTYINMRETLDKEIQVFVNNLNALGGVGLCIIEDGDEEVVSKVTRQLEQKGFRPCADHLAIMDDLANSNDTLYYRERGDKLDGSVLEIVAEFDVGMVSLADKNAGRLVVAQWEPETARLAIIMTRAQIESSYPRLFQYCRFNQSL